MFEFMGSTRVVAADHNSDLATALPAPGTVLADVGAYVASPLHWDRTDWSLMGGSVAAIALAHHYDTSVRDHFARGAPLDAKDSSDLKDAIPAAALVVGTWLYGSFLDVPSAWTAAWAMTEAAGLSAGTTYLLKAVAGRERPNETTDPNSWRKGGSSFPSLHVSAAFAIGTSFAESGTEGGSRWLTRTLGYGIAGYTTYERVKHNAHWLSDAVAGMAVGTATGLFVVHRTYRNSALSGLAVEPLPGGMLVSYHLVLPAD